MQERLNHLACLLRGLLLFLFLLESLTSIRIEMQKKPKEGRKKGVSLLRKGERDHMNTISVGASHASVVAMSPEDASAIATGSVSGSGIGAVITGMSVRAMRTTTDLSMTESDVIEAEKKIHLTKKRLQWIQVKSGKQYIVSTVNVNAIKI